MKPTRLTMSAKRRKKYVAAHDRRRAAMEAPMSPQAERVRVPPTMTLAPRWLGAPMPDERPLLRDERGRVLAVVEVWSPN